MRSTEAPVEKIRSTVRASLLTVPTSARTHKAGKSIVEGFTRSGSRRTPSDGPREGCGPRRLRAATFAGCQPGSFMVRGCYADRMTVQHVLVFGVTDIRAFRIE